MLQSALEKLIRVTREYISPGIPEVDEALENANNAIKTFERISRIGNSAPAFPKNEGLNGRMPTVL